MTRNSFQRKLRTTGCLLTGTTAVWSIPPCTCCIHASGISFYTISALFQHPSRIRSARAYGLVLGENGEKMSKSRGNVVNPDTIVDEIGADAFRLYEMFMGAFDQPIPWSTTGAKGCKRF